MGNRAVICFGKYEENAIGVYLHWNGGRDSIEGFLNATKQVMGGRVGDKTYSQARLIQVIGNFFGGNSSLGMGFCRELDCDNYDNGVYEVDIKTLTITGRKFFEGEEQQEYELEEMTKEILKRQPKDDLAVPAVV